MIHHDMHIMIYHEVIFRQICFNNHRDVSWSIMIYHNTFRYATIHLREVTLPRNGPHYGINISTIESLMKLPQSRIDTVKGLYYNYNQNVRYLVRFGEKTCSNLSVYMCPNSIIPQDQQHCQSQTGHIASAQLSSDRFVTFSNSESKTKDMKNLVLCNGRRAG